MFTRSIRHTLQLTLFLSLCFTASLTTALSEETLILDESRLVSGRFQPGELIPGLFAGTLRDGFRYVRAPKEYPAVFDLGGAFETVEFQFGIPDDEQGGYREVTLKVLSDGKTLGSFTHLRGRPPVAVSIGVQGVRALTLAPHGAPVGYRLCARRVHRSHPPQRPPA